MKQRYPPDMGNLTKLIKSCRFLIEDKTGLTTPGACGFFLCALAALWGLSTVIF